MEDQQVRSDIAAAWLDRSTARLLATLERQQRAWAVLDDPYVAAMRRLSVIAAMPNPYLPQQVSPHVQWWGADWAPVWNSRPRPVVGEFTDADWAAWWSWGRPRVVEFPSWTAHHRRVRNYRWFMTLLAVEQRADLITAATGRIMGLHHRGGQHGLRKLHGQEDRTPGPVRRRHRAQIPHRR